LRAARFALWGFVLLTGFALLGAERGATIRAELVGARVLLMQGNGPAAERVFARYQRWPVFARTALAGLALSRALAGDASRAGHAAPEEIRAFDPVQLMDGAWRAGRLEPVRALGVVAEAAGVPLASVYRAAVALERGQDERARSLLRAEPVLFASRGLGREIGRVFALRDAGAAAIVRDRRGELVGHRTRDGGLAVAEGIDPAWIPDPEATAVAQAPPAPGLRLALDLDLTRLALESLGPYRGSIVLLDPRTGGILAAVSDPRTAHERGMPFLTERREPASIAKIITAAAALRAGFDPDAMISAMTCTGHERFGRGIVWCSYAAGHLSGLDQALAVSCNTAFAHLGRAVGREALLAEYRRWGFGGGPESLLGSAGRIVAPAGDDRQLADLSIGLEASDITPLHAALLAAVMADDGAMPEPILVEAVQGPLGREPRSLPRPPARPILDAASRTRLLQAMRAVAVYGTAAAIAPPGFPVAMKTGTGATPHLGYHANYVGVGPMPDPTLAFCVRITHEPNSHYVSRAAREVLGALLAGLGARTPARACR
jgi:peptidoglycan glycosyltransferase